MGTQYEKKIIWTIKNFSSLQAEKIYSDHFVVGRCKWRLLAHPKGNNAAKYMSLFLDVADSESLPCAWKRHAQFRLTIVNQLSDELSQVREPQSSWYDKKTPTLGLRDMLSLTKLHAKDGGFLVNNEVKITAEVEVLEVIGNSDALEETSYLVKTTDVNGFQVLPSQVESVNSLFEKHPDIASNFHTENQLLRTTYLNVLLSLIELLCKSTEELSSSDLADAYSLLRDVTKAGFKLDWLEKKLKEAGETRVQESEEELKNLKRKCSDMEALLDFLQ